MERLLARLLGPRADVEDVLQLTLIAAVSAFPRFRGEASVTTWLARIAVRTAHAHLRSASVRRPRVALELLPTEPRDDGPSVEQRMDAHRALRRLHEHLDALGPRKRIAFVLHAVDGRTVDEVAALMGATVAGTKSRLFFARRALMARVTRDPALRDILGSLSTTRRNER